MIQKNLHPLATTHSSTTKFLNLRIAMIMCPSKLGKVHSEISLEPIEWVCRSVARENLLSKMSMVEIKLSPKSAASYSHSGLHLD